MRENVQDKIIIGVTGGFSSGKSTFSAMMSEKGALCIDADELVHDIFSDDASVKAGLMKEFGDGIFLSGALNRKNLREIVFSDRGKLKKLCDIVHPVVMERIRKKIRDAKKPVIVIDAPLLIESGLYREVDIVVVVTASEKVQLKRAKSRGFSKEESRGIMTSQMPIDEKAAHADLVINNDGDIDKLKEGADKLWRMSENLRKKSWIS